jgi:hypothetical protein
MKNITERNLIPGFEHDGNNEDFRLHLKEDYRFSARKKKDYNKIRKDIDNFLISGDGWEVYCWYDISGFDYWVKNMKESNYLTISISFTNSEIDDLEIDKIISASESAMAFCYDIQERTESQLPEYQDPEYYDHEDR